MEFVEENKVAFNCLQKHLDDGMNIAIKQRFVSAFDECPDTLQIFPIIIAASIKNKSIVFRDKNDIFATSTYKWWSRNNVSDNQMLGALLEQTGTTGRSHRVPS